MLSPVLKVVSEGGIETGVAVAAAFVISRYVGLSSAT